MFRRCGSARASLLPSLFYSCSPSLPTLLFPAHLLFTYFFVLFLSFLSPFVLCSLSLFLLPFPSFLPMSVCMFLTSHFASSSLFPIHTTHLHPSHFTKTPLLHLFTSHSSPLPSPFLFTLPPSHLSLSRYPSKSVKFLWKIEVTRPPALASWEILRGEVD